MAVIEIERRDRASRSSAFVSKQTTSEHKSFRLPADRKGELEELFCQVESRMGIKTGFFQDMAADAGCRPNKKSNVNVDDSVELMGSEKWLNTSARKRREYARARRTLTALDPSHLHALWRVYGPPDPHVRSIFPAEISPLVIYTDVVEARRCAMRDALAEQRIERAYRAAARADEATEFSREDRAARIQELQDEADGMEVATAEQRKTQVRLRSEQAALVLEQEQAARSYRTLPPAMSPCVRDRVERSIRRGCDAEVTRAMALDLALHAQEVGDATAKRAARDALKAFVAKAERQADRLLADASMAYQKAWWTL